MGNLFKIGLHLMKLTSLLRKLKLLDYLIIIIVILGGFILYKFLNPEEKWINVEVMDANIPVFRAYSVKEGDIEKSPTGETIAEVSDVITYSNLQSSVNATNGPTSNKDIRVQLKLKTKINSRTGEYEYKNKIIKVGSPIELRLTNGQINGTISEIREDSSTEEKFEPIEVALKIYGQWPWYADSIKPGVMTNLENPQARVEILEKKVVPAEITVDDANGQKILTTDPQKVDITLRVKMLVQKFGNTIVFKKDQAIIIGEKVSFVSNGTKITEAYIVGVK